MLEETYLLICFQHILSASTGIQARQAGLNWLPVLNFLFIYNTLDWEGRCVWLLMFRLIRKLIVAALDIHLNAIKYF